MIGHLEESRFRQTLEAFDASAETEALASQIIGSTWTNVDFTCPAARDAGEPGGGYGYYTAPVLPTDANRPITCQVL